MHGWLEVGTAALALLVCYAAGTFPFAALAAPADDPGMGRPVAMDLHAVTLELRCREPLAKGAFHAVRARIINAEVWAGGLQQARADAGGFSGLPGGKSKADRPAPPGLLQLKGGTAVLVTLKAEADAALEIDTEAGKADVRLKEVDFYPPRKYLDGAIRVRRLPSSTRLAASNTDNDQPAAVRGPDGSVWVAFVAYRSGGEPDMEAAAKEDFATFVTRGNGDQIRLVRFDGKQWSAPLAVTEPLLDLWKPTVAVDGAGKVWVAWSQNVGGNWDLYRRGYDPLKGQWSPVQRMTIDPGSDIHVVSATDAQGNVYWAWQGRRGRYFQIFLASEMSGTAPIAVTANAANHWDPAIAADSKGNVYVAWDSYENGNYDVFMRRFQGTRPEPVIAVAATSKYETRASLAVDYQDRVWIAYEQGGVNWGKDFGAVVPKSANFKQGEGADGLGIPLYNARRVVVKCYAEGRVQMPADPAVAWGELPHPKSFARLALAADGRLWLLFRHHPLPSGARETWAEYAMSYDGRVWGPPQMLPDSDNLLDNRPAVVPFGRDGMMAVYSSDYRLRGARNMEGEGFRPLKNDLYAAWLCAKARTVPPQLTAAAATAAVAAPVHPHESQDIRRLREFRVECAGKSYQLARGEFHRHTEYTAHRDGDGSLEDMWRYAQDAADMDWLGNADHDNGFGHQYPWWIIQKTATIYHNPPWFIAPFTYERSVVYPNGHRNVIFAQRGIRTLPRGDMSGDEKAGTPDTKMLYAYLRHFGGICASHTSATGMGTDGRDNDRLLEPVVEIYQGDRNNYECEVAPRGITPRQMAANPADTNNQIHPQGFVWNALAKGYRFGFESSSDHVSTHASYAIALVDYVRVEQADANLAWSSPMWVHASAK
jgi:hypothetical protein